MQMTARWKTATIGGAALFALLVLATVPFLLRGEAALAPLPEVRGAFNIYLMAGDDVTREMVLRFHSAAPLAEPAVFVSSGGEETQITASETLLPNTDPPRYLYRAALTDLQPDTRYAFRISGDDADAPFHFRTPPDDGSALRLMFCGDMDITPPTPAMLRDAAARAPHLAVLGGDIAYADDDDPLLRWDYWFRNWSGEMRTPAGDLVPMVVALGNHDLDIRVKGPAIARAPHFLSFFGEAGEHAYLTCRIGAQVGLVLLDTNYLDPIPAQAPWLAEQLEGFAGLPFVFGVYHEPLYPVYGKFGNPEAEQGRAHWQPLFEAHQVTACFEHHDHLLKRTHPIRGGAVADDGVIYLGDGGMGVEDMRRPKHANEWYVAHTEMARHYWFVTLAEGEATFEAIGEDGAVLDRTVRSARSAVGVAAER